ncbi:siderophore-interacting protein [Saccharopolyspora sp. HNM0983]|uniref:Siderophore-interacting protein n=1 Tax=Saccharopolyspora montiporae TaxID=2781240 RepID=A0A929BBX9_9PSEU|nr:siderophore-interacting protein [Saccharopolyspora sp. HNM0983]MBE9375206.1 siderophore-interacting protein [Saccharopolyspora sp. HNM0983]
MTATITTGANRTKPAYRLFPVDVSRVRPLGPSFVRITFTGECLRSFGSAGDDQRIKIVLPQPGRTISDFPDGPDWYSSWLGLPERIRPVLRTYTVRTHRPESAELDIDFVLHGIDSGHGGPATHWAANTVPGDRIGLLGPDRPGGGRMWGCEWAPPETADQLVLAGDETAVPAVAAILEALPDTARGIACLEVPEPRDRQDWNCPPGVDVRWFFRHNHGTEHGALLETALLEAVAELQPHRSTGTQLDDVDVDTGALWEVPERTATGRVYGWLAGEAGTIKRLRRILVTDRGLPRESVAFMGYWRHGRS